MNNRVKILLLMLLCAIAGYYAYNYLTKPQSPFIIYAANIPGTYRLGFTNLDTELSDVNLPVQGTIPDWLSGTLLRNGPAKFNTKSSWVADWFDGLAMIHAFKINNGSVSYTNKFLKTNDYKTVQNTGKMNYAGFMQDPCGSVFKNIFCWFKTGEVEHVSGMPNANVNIVNYSDHMAALTEIPLPIEFDPQTLETLGVIDYTDNLPKEDIHDTAHPHYDPKTKEHLGYFTQFGRMSTVNIFSIADGTTTRRIIGSYEVEEPSYMHSFAITPQYAILTALPLVVNPLELLSGKAFINCFKWKPKLGTQLVVVNRKTGTVHKFKTEPFFAFHTINAYEKGNSIVLDIINYPDASGLEQASFDDILAPTHAKKDTTSGHAHRYIIDITSGNIESIVLSPAYLELPRINYAYNGKDYTYLYAFAESNRQEHPYVADKLVKLNVKTGEIIQWQKPHCFPGEPVFVARPDANREDDGLVLSVVLDAQHNSSFLLILNAQDFTEIARAYAPHHIPFGIHGQFYSQLR